MHLLPSFHFASVADEKDKWKHVGKYFSVCLAIFEVPP